MPCDSTPTLLQPPQLIARSARLPLNMSDWFLAGGSERPGIGGWTGREGLAHDNGPSCGRDITTSPFNRPTPAAADGPPRIPRGSRHSRSSAASRDSPRQ